MLTITPNEPRANPQPPSRRTLTTQVASARRISARTCWRRTLPTVHARTLYTLHRLAIHLPAAVRAEPDWRQTLGMVSMQCNTVRGNGLPRKQCEGSRTVGRAGFPYCRTCGDGERCGTGVYIGRMTSST